MASNVIVVPDSTEDRFNQILKENDIRLHFFKYVVNIDISTPGQSNTAKLNVSGTKFLVRDIEIHGYDKHGSLFGIGNMPRDRFTVMLRNLTTNDNYFNAAVDFTHFSPLKNTSVGTKLTPFVIDRNTSLEFEIKHEPVVTGNEYNELIDFSQPVKFQIIISGAKLFDIKEI